MDIKQLNRLEILLMETLLVIREDWDTVDVRPLQTDVEEAMKTLQLLKYIKEQDEHTKTVH